MHAPISRYAVFSALSLALGACVAPDPSTSPAAPSRLAARAAPAEASPPGPPEAAGGSAAQPGDLCTPFQQGDTVALPDAQTLHCYEASPTALLCPGAQVTAIGGLPSGLGFQPGVGITGQATLPGVWHPVVSITLANGFSVTGTATLRVIGPLRPLISEILVNPPTCTTDEQLEWIELYNPAPWPWPLDGWSLSDATAKVVPFPKGAAVPAHGVFVWSRNADAYQGIYGFGPDAGDLSLAFNNGGDTVWLQSPWGVADCLSWGSGDGCEDALPGGQNGYERQLGCDLQWSPTYGLGRPGCAHGLLSETSPPPPLCDPTAADDATCFSCALPCPVGPEVGLCGPAFGVVGEPLSLSADCAETSTSADATWTWALGDGSPPVFGAQPALVYDTPGEHTLEVVVSQGGLSARATQIVSVITPPPASIRLRTNLPPHEQDLFGPLIAALTQAQYTVDVAFFDIDHPGICQALAEAATHAALRMVIEDNAYVPKTCLNALATAGVSLVWDKNPLRMHNKFVVIDRGPASAAEPLPGAPSLVWTGSSNATSNAAIKNPNNSVLLSSAALADAYTAEFEQLFAGLFGAAKADVSVANIAVGDLGSVDEVDTAVWFSPAHDVRAELLALIAGAKASIRVMVFSFTDADIANALRARFEDGIDVRVVMEKANCGKPGSVYPMLQDAGLPVRVDAFGGFMHHKVLVVDGHAGADTTPYAVTGSYNLSALAANSNDENLLVFRNAAMAAAYADVFDILWDHHSNPDRCP